MHRTSALLITALSLTGASGQTLNAREYAEHCVNYYAREYGVPSALVRAIIHVESGWQPGAVSRRGAMGLMQLMPATALRFGVSHPFYIHENIRGGVAYLAELQAIFHDDLRLVVAAYAAGEKPVLMYGVRYSSPVVYFYVKRIAADYRIELNRDRRR